MQNDEGKQTHGPTVGLPGSPYATDGTVKPIGSGAPLVHRDRLSGVLLAVGALPPTSLAHCPSRLRSAYLHISPPPDETTAISKVHDAPECRVWQTRVALSIGTTESPQTKSPLRGNKMSRTPRVLLLPTPWKLSDVRFSKVSGENLALGVPTGDEVLREMGKRRASERNGLGNLRDTTRALGTRLQPFSVSKKVVPLFRHNEKRASRHRR